MINRKHIFSSLVLLLAIALAGHAQPNLGWDLSTVMEIPSIITMESSPAHTYVLSDTEGMIVFRTYADSLQWLYSSTGMGQRGNTITTDIRFAYLYGDQHRITVLEPTSVLGVYSSTLLPERPRNAQRVGQNLYVALGPNGLGKLSLRTPVSVDSAIQMVEREMLKDDLIINLTSSSDRLFVLNSQGSLYLFNKTKTGVSFSEELQLSTDLNRLFLVGNTLMGSDSDGNIYEISAGGNLSRLGTINEPVLKIKSWKDWLVIKGQSDRVWTSYQNRSPVLWKDDPEAGNHFVVAKGQLWLSEFNKVSRIKTTSDEEIKKTPSMEEPANAEEREPRVSADTELRIEPIENQIIPYPKPLLLSFELAGNYPMELVEFAYQSEVNNATIKGNSLYWQPEASQVGNHTFKIIATSSRGDRDNITFTVDVNSFNAPPSFVPLRPMSTPVGEPFSVPIKALDRDAMDPSLVRYLGVNLPEGASIDEDTGLFEWTPTPRQVGENTFRVIATDQYGAASSVTVSLEVVEVPDQDSEEDGEGGP